MPARPRGARPVLPAKNRMDGNNKVLQDGICKTLVFLVCLPPRLLLGNLCNGINIGLFWDLIFGICVQK